MLPGPVAIGTGRIGTMAINKGIAPPDFTTQVGQLRSALKDVAYTAIPEEPGFGEYESFSDIELEGLLARAGGSSTRATGFAYLELSGQAASQALEWASDDQRVNLAKRAAALLEVAKFWFTQADVEDLAAGADYFAIEYPFGNPYDNVEGDYYTQFSLERWANDKW